MATETSTLSGLKDGQGNPVRLKVHDEIVLDIKKAPDRYHVQLSFRRPISARTYESFLFSDRRTEKALRFADSQSIQDLISLVAETNGLSFRIWEHSFGIKICEFL